MIGFNFTVAYIFNLKSLFFFHHFCGSLYVTSLA